MKYEVFAEKKMTVSDKVTKEHKLLRFFSEDKLIEHYLIEDTELGAKRWVEYQVNCYRRHGYKKVKGIISSEEKPEFGERVVR